MNITPIEIIAYLIPIAVWALVIGITLRLMVKKQSVSATISWLMVIYLLPVVGILAYLIFGEITLGRKHQQATQTLQPKYMEWFKQVSECEHLINKPANLAYSAIFDLTRKRLNIPCIIGNELHILDTPKTIIHSIINDIKKATQSINMVFYIWAEDGMVNDCLLYTSPSPRDS